MGKKRGSDATLIQHIATSSRGFRSLDVTAKVLCWQSLEPVLSPGTWANLGQYGISVLFFVMTNSPYSVAVKHLSTSKHYWHWLSGETI